MKHFYAEICKVDDEKRMVYGYASTEALDVQGEIVTKQAMAEALEDYMRFANIREMHQPSAVGVAKSVEMDDKGTFISAHVVDDSAWSKVKAGVYKGFSIGGKAIEKVDNVINALRLTEIKQALADMERMFALTAEHTEIADVPGAPALAVGAGEVRFEHVDFSYDPQRQIQGTKMPSFWQPKSRRARKPGGSAGCTRGARGRLVRCHRCRRALSL